MAPPYHPALDYSWRTLLSALLELFIACLILLTTLVTLITSRLVKFFELPHPCTYITLGHERSSPPLCGHHRRLALVSVEQRTCVECLQADRSQVLPLYTSDQAACQSCYVNNKISNGDAWDVQENEDKQVKGKVGVIEDEIGKVQQPSSVVWCDRKSFKKSGPTGDRCVKRKFSKFSVEERGSGDHEGDKLELRLESLTEVSTSPGDGDGEAAKADLQTVQQDREPDKAETGASVESVKAAFQAERDALGSLYTELEEERNAAAIAANEAMAMITRLQEEKAAVQMEARQYQRMVEEKSEYDQEAITLLKEILFKREQEKYVLEKEVESYRKTLLRSGGDSWEFYEDKVPLPLPFRRSSSDILYLEGNRKRDDLEILRGINLLESFESASGDRESPYSGKLCKPLAEHDADLSGDRLRYVVSENGDETPDNKELNVSMSSDVDRRTTSMVIRDNFKLSMEEDIRELTTRLQVLEDDRNSMKQMVHSLKSDKQELRELAQNLRELHSPPESVKLGDVLVHEEGAVPPVSQISSLLSSSSKKRRLEQLAEDLTASSF